MSLHKGTAMSSVAGSPHKEDVSNAQEEDVVSLGRCRCGGLTSTAGGADHAADPEAVVSLGRTRSGAGCAAGEQTSSRIHTRTMAVWKWRQENKRRGVTAAAAAL